MLIAACGKTEPASTLILPTHLPTNTPAPISPEPSLRPTNHPSPTSTPIPTLFSIGVSVFNQPIEVYRIGSGDRALILIAALHGDEGNTSTLLMDIHHHYESYFPIDSLSLYILPYANPDAIEANSRHNANGVDLNRNWETDNWDSDTVGPYGSIPGGGGRVPFSEPETKALSTWLLDLQANSSFPVIVIIYHAYFSPDGSLQPSFTLTEDAIVPNPTAAALGESYAIIINSYYATTWEAYEVTGDALNWCGENAFICLEIELPSRAELSPTAFLNHMTALDALILSILNQ